jgi:hypothetical protein
VLVDGQGIVRKTYPRVAVSTHARQVLDDAAELGLTDRDGKPHRDREDPSLG